MPKHIGEAFSSSTPYVPPMLQSGPWSKIRDSWLVIRDSWLRKKYGWHIPWVGDSWFVIRDSWLRKNINNLFLFELVIRDLLSSWKKDFCHHPYFWRHFLRGHSLRRLFWGGQSNLETSEKRHFELKTKNSVT